MSYGAINVVGSYNVPQSTANAGTDFVALIPPFQAWSKNVQPIFTGISFLDFTVGATAQTAYIMRPLGFTRVASDAAISQAVINIDADPGKYAATATSNGVTSESVQGGTFTFRTADNGIAANDYCAYQCSDGTWVVDTVASVATLAITMTTNVPTGGIKAGTPFYWFGLKTDTNPYDAQAHPLLNLFVTEAKGALTFGTEGNNVPFVAGYGPNNPLIIYVTNATNAATLERGTVLYYQSRPSPFGNGPIPLPNPAPNG